MRSPRDPIRALRSRLVLTWTLGVGVIFGCAWWAKAPPEPVPTVQPPESLRPVTAEALLADPPIDVSPFSLSLWNLPMKQPPPVPTKSAKPAPIPLELLAIVNNPQCRYVALYDRTEDRVVLANEGELVRGWTLSAIAEALVQFRQGDRLEELRLEEGPG